MKTLTSTLCILAVSLFAFVSTSAAQEKKEEKKAAKTYTVGVSGATWKVGCPPRVRAALKKVSGVKSVEFDSAKNVATVSMKKGEEMKKEDAEAAFKGSQYGVTSFDEAKKEGKKKKKEAA